MTDKQALNVTGVYCILGAIIAWGLEISNGIALCLLILGILSFVITDKKFVITDKKFVVADKKQGQKSKEIIKTFEEIYKNL